MCFLGWEKSLRNTVLGCIPWSETAGFEYIYNAFSAFTRYGQIALQSGHFSQCTLPALWILPFV